MVRDVQQKIACMVQKPTPKTFELEEEAANDAIRLAREAESMDSDESFTDLSLDADVTDTTECEADTDGITAMDNTDSTDMEGDSDYEDVDASTSDCGSLSDAAESDSEPTKREKLKAEMRSIGWDDLEISQWEPEQDELSEAMTKVSIYEISPHHGDQEDRPDVWIMYDDGAFRALLGLGARPLMINIKKLDKPYPVDTAGTTIWITKGCDLIRNGYIIRDCLVNPTNAHTSLLSEGRLALFDRWEFHLTWERMRVCTPDGREHNAYRKGVQH